MPEIQDTNESINNRLEEQEPAGLASVYTGQGWQDNPKGAQEKENELSGLPEWEPAPGALQKRYTQAEKDKEALREAQQEPQPVIKKRAVGKKVVQGKVLDAEAVVGRLKEQIAAIEVVAKVEIPEIPAIMIKEYRDVLINLQKAIEKSKTEAITAIQAL